MKNIINKGLFFIIGSYLILSDTISETHLVIVLLVLINSALLELMTHKVLSLLYIPLFIFFPQSLPFMALAVLDANKLALLLYVPIMVRFFDPITLFLIVLAGLMRYYSQESTNYHTQYMKSIDHSREEKLQNDQLTRLLNQNHEHEIISTKMKERNRIARDIHDNVGHQLSSSIIQVGAITLLNEQKDLEESLQDLKSTLDTAMNSIRNSVHQLHNQSIQLDEEIRIILNTLKPRTLDFKYQLEETPSNTISETLLLMIKEASHNILKHSNATQVQIHLTESAEAYQLLIHDNGTAIKKNKTFGLGLNSMNQRVQDRFGIFNIQIENGYRIYASIPKKEQA